MVFIGLLVDVYYLYFLPFRLKRTKMNLEELKSKLPMELQPWAITYGPAFLAITAEELQEWLQFIIAGDIYKAYGDVLAKLPNTALLSEWTKINASWQEANVKNKAQNDLAKSAMLGLMKILLAIALASVGL